MWLSKIGKPHANRRHRGVRLVEFRGETKTLSEWARIAGISKQSLSRRIKFWGVEKELTSQRSK